jgi:hypothetical protein
LDTAGDIDDEQKIEMGTGAVIRHGIRKVAVYRDAHGASQGFRLSVRTWVAL